MDDSKWERWGNLGGILFAVLVIVTVVISGSPPKISDSPAKIANYFVEHADDLKWAGYIGALATIPLFFWLGSVWRLLRRADGGVPRLGAIALAGLVFAAAMAGVAGLVMNAMALRGVAGTGGADGTKFFYTLSWVFNAAGAIGIAIFLSAFSIAIMRTGILPKILGWFGAVVALVLVVGAASMASEDDVLMTLVFVGLAGALIFVVAASILMLRAPRVVAEIDIVITESVT
ncbi:MAG: hypothetical protein WEB19_04195 [Acidimicrobiia bacterium]